MRKGSTVSVAISVLLAQSAAVPTAVRAQGNATILKPAEMEKLMPATVFYGGQSATTQLRNSGGVKFADGFFILASDVDTSGYSSAIATKYQAYFITEVPIQIGGKKLGTGVYGIGFIADNKFVVTDVGAHEVLTVDSATDANLKLPNPCNLSLIRAEDSGSTRGTGIFSSTVSSCIDRLTFHRNAGRRLSSDPMDAPLLAGWR